jgi:Co/Zn/Cd efflux system component
VIVRLPESESSVYMSRDDCLEQGIRSSVWVTLLAINALMLLIEAAIGWLAQSSALLADSLDMLADAAVFEILRNAKSTVPREVVSEES